MGKHQSVEVQDTFSWSMCEYEEYVAGYKLYKQLKEKWDAIEKGETANAIMQILG